MFFIILVALVMFHWQETCATARCNQKMKFFFILGCVFPWGLKIPSSVAAASCACLQTLFFVCFVDLTPRSVCNSAARKCSAAWYTSLCHQELGRERERVARGRRREIRRRPQAHSMQEPERERESREKKRLWERPRTQWVSEWVYSHKHAAAASGGRADKQTPHHHQERDALCGFFGQQSRHFFSRWWKTFSKCTPVARGVSLITNAHKK